jgi:hypothetical protein
MNVSGFLDLYVVVFHFADLILEVDGIFFRSG